MAYCTQCGVQLENGSHFCGSCGQSVIQEEKEVSSSSNEMAWKVRKPWRLHEVFFLLACIGAFAGVLLPLLAQITSTSNPGNPSMDQQMAGRGMLMFGLCVYLLGRWRGWRYPWMHAFVGFSFLLLTVVTVNGVRNFRQTEEQLSPVQNMLLSLKKFDSLASARLVGRDVNKIERAQILRTSFKKAIRQAPDDAVLRFNESRLRVFSTDMHASWCRKTAYQELALIINNGWQDVPSSSSQEELVQTTAEEQKIMMEAMTYLFEAAAPYAGKGTTINAARVQQLMRKVKTEADPLDLFRSAAALDTLTPSDLCRLHRNFMNVVHRLPPADGAMILRYMTSFD